ncbi:MAG: sugar phosphate isomerase/epimerase family protein [Planctomycetota bacterium]|jgi:hexulose-6-phosphate isomerase
MSKSIDRRSFMKRSAGGVLVGVLSASASRVMGAQSADTFKNSKLKKSLILHLFPDSLSIADRFKMASDTGFDGMEIPTTENEKDVEAIKAAADKTGIKVHSIMNMRHWKHPLSANNPEVAKYGLEGLKISLGNAKAVGADAVLLVPAVVKPNVRYKDAYQRSQREISKVLPLARELGVIIAVENVWNRFLLSPLEFARYVDEFKDPYLQAYFDVGNVVGAWGYPQDWILTLGKRIKKLHLKDFNFKKKQFVPIREGSVNWPSVRKAIDQIGYNGFLTLEDRYEKDTLKQGDTTFLKKVSKKIDLIIAGK